MAEPSAQLQTWLRESQRPVVFTGAGISTDSGIPDFRGPSGYWKKNQPIMFEDFIGSEEVRIKSWTRHFEGGHRLGNAEPNAGHHFVAALMQHQPAAWLITQNVDGLHQRAGSPPKQVIEIHGNATYASCLECGARYQLEALRTVFESSGKPPYCDMCGGIVKTATISFGQPMSEQAMREAQARSLAADLFLVLGSSLVVYPAADLPELAKRQGARLVILNREQTSLDGIADLVIHKGISEVLDRIDLD